MGRKLAPSSAAYNEQIAMALNNLAWLLSTCEDPRERQPDEAVQYAERAVKLAEEEGNYWNTLGAAYCRAERWDDARRALARSMELRKGEGDAYDWYFLAILEGRQDRMDLARDWYDKAAAWTASTHPDDLELHRFRVEAARLLELPAPDPPAAGKPARPVGMPGRHAAR
jgi:tetratricopeptide (TPR) repeat protein